MNFEIEFSVTNSIHQKHFASLLLSLSSILDNGLYYLIITQFLPDLGFKVLSWVGKHPAPPPPASGHLDPTLLNPTRPLLSPDPSATNHPSGQSLPVV